MGTIAQARTGNNEELSLRELTRAEFGRRLEELMLKKGWNQSELARQASHHLSAPMGRDSVSNYVRGRSYPGPSHLHALAKALNVEPYELLPNQLRHRASESNAPALEIKQVDGQPDLVWLRINQAVDYNVALQVMKLLSERQ